MDGQVDFSASVPFSALCELFERVFAIGKTSAKKKLLHTFFSRYKSTNFFPLLRLLLPQLDKDRQTYGMKETNLGKYYVELLTISSDSEDGRRLLHWRRPTKQGEMEAGDFGNAVYMSLQKRCRDKGMLSLHHINHSLDQLNCQQDRKEKVKVLKWLLRRTTAREQKWLVRIILKELKIGLSEKTILTTFHPDALDLFQATSSISKVATELSDPLKRLDNKNQSIGLFNPIKPMLAARKTPEEVVAVMSGHAFIIETKFDGERVQIHKDNDRIKLYSRNSNDVTSLYGPKLIPILMKHITVPKCILDGELLVWDSIAQKYEDFGKLKTFANFSENDENGGDAGSNIGKQLCFVVFDILYVNDKSVLDLTLQQRMLLIKRCVNHSEKQIEIVQQKPASTTEEIIAALDQAIINREEGLMVKNLDSLYVPGERKEKWIKLKPEYIQGVVTDMDLLIIGGYYGSGIGRRGGTISHFLLGVAAPLQEGEDTPKKYLSFCKVGSGYSDQELKVLQKMLEKHWRAYDVNSPPAVIELVPPFKEKPDVWIEPKKSKILQVKAAQLVPSEKFMTRYTLRFPRVEKLRLDKNWNDSLDLIELQGICRSHQGTRTYKRISDVDRSPSEMAGKKRKVQKTKKTHTLVEHFQKADTSDLAKLSSLFSKREFCVLTGSNSHSKAQIERLLFQHDAESVQHPTSNTFCVIAEKQTLKVANLIKTATYDIVKPDWVIDSVAAGAILPLEPRYMLFTTLYTQQQFLHDIDEFNDHYTKDVSSSGLKDILKDLHNRPNFVEFYFNADQVAEFEFKYFLQTPWWGMFRNYAMYFDMYETVNDPATLIANSNLENASLMAQFYGAEISSKIELLVTHIIIDRDDTSRLEMIKKKITACGGTNQRIVTKEWVLDCINNHEDLDEREYYLD